jgi:hypothetical protein
MVSPTGIPVTAEDEQLRTVPLLWLNAEGCIQLLRAGRVVLRGARNGHRICRRRCAVRRRGHRLGSRRIGDRRHCTFRIQQMVFAGSQPEFDESAGVGNRLALPAMIGLVAAHRLFAGLGPRARGLSAHVVFADECFLNRLRSLGVDFLLPASACRFFPGGAFSCGCSVILARGFLRVRGTGRRGTRMMLMRRGL